MKCAKCKSENLTFMVPVYLEMPIKHYRRITKLTLREKSTKIMGANWENETIRCLDCGNIEKMK